MKCLAVEWHRKECERKMESHSSRPSIIIADTESAFVGGGEVWERQQLCTHARGLRRRKRKWGRKRWALLYNLIVLICYSWLIFGVFVKLNSRAGFGGMFPRLRLDCLALSAVNCYTSSLLYQLHSTSFCPQFPLSHRNSLSELRDFYVEELFFLSTINSFESRKNWMM